MGYQAVAIRLESKQFRKRYLMYLSYEACSTDATIGHVALALIPYLPNYAHIEVVCSSCKRVELSEGTMGLESEDESA